MINEIDFNVIQERANNYKYTSFTYLDYDDCSNSEILCNDKDHIILLDSSKSPAMFHFAADNFELVLRELLRSNTDVQINFVPYEYRQQLIQIGFIERAEFIDFFNMNLVTTPIANNFYDKIDFLLPQDCEQVSNVSKHCANQSRGFTGETATWFVGWLKEGNEVIIVRKNDMIAGFCCVSIYNNGTTLWVREIAVDPAYQGEGFGTKLLEQAICYGVTKGAIKGFLAADVLNLNAIKLYNKYGFCAKDTVGELQMQRIL